MEDGGGAEKGFVGLGVLPLSGKNVVPPTSVGDGLELVVRQLKRRSR
jgi:hypothetical protein